MSNYSSPERWENDSRAHQFSQRSQLSSIVEPEDETPPESSPENLPLQPPASSVVVQSILLPQKPHLPAKQTKPTKTLLKGEVPAPKPSSKKNFQCNLQTANGRIAALENAHMNLYDAYDELYRFASNAVDTLYKSSEKIHKDMAKVHQAKSGLETKVNNLTKANADASKEVTGLKNKKKSLQNKLNTANERLSRKNGEISDLQKQVKEQKGTIREMQRAADEKAKHNQQLVTHQLKMEQAEHSAQLKSHHKQMEQERKTQAKNDRYNRMTGASGMFNAGSAGNFFFNRGSFPGSNDQTMVCVYCMCLKLRPSLFLLIHCTCRKMMIAVEARVAVARRVTVEADITRRNVTDARAAAVAAAIAALTTPNTRSVPVVAVAVAVAVDLFLQASTQVNTLPPLLMLVSIKSMRNTNLQDLKDMLILQVLLPMEHLHHNIMVIPACRTPVLRVNTMVVQVRMVWLLCIKMQISVPMNFLHHQSVQLLWLLQSMIESLKSDRQI